MNTLTHPSPDSLQVTHAPLDPRPVLDEVMAVGQWAGELSHIKWDPLEDPFFHFFETAVRVADAGYTHVMQRQGWSTRSLTSPEGVASRLSRLPEHLATQCVWLLIHTREPELRKEMESITQHDSTHYRKLLTAFMPAVLMASNGYAFVTLREDSSEPARASPFLTPGAVLAVRPWAAHSPR